MQRRKFVIGLGALASGTAAAVGSGAFSAVQADRSISVNVKGDENAYLGLKGNINEYTNVDDSGRLELVFDDMNPDALTEFTNLFNVQNNGTRDVRVFIDVSAVGSEWNFSIYGPNGDDQVDDKTDGAGFTFAADEVPPNGNVGVILEPGANVDASVIFGAYDGDSPDEGEELNEEITVYAVSDDSEYLPNSGPSDATDAVPTLSDDSE